MVYCVVCYLMFAFGLWRVICCFVAGCGGFGFGLLVGVLFIVVLFGLLVGVTLLVVFLIVVVIWGLVI